MDYIKALLGDSVTDSDPENIPLWEALTEFKDTLINSENNEEFTVKDAKAWVRENYSEEQNNNWRNSSFTPHLRMMSTNNRSRVKNWAIREDHNVFFSLGKGRYRPYNPDKDPEPIMTPSKSLPDIELSFPPRHFLGWYPEGDPHWYHKKNQGFIDSQKWNDWTMMMGKLLQDFVLIYNGDSPTEKSPEHIGRDVLGLKKSKIANYPISIIKHWKVPNAQKPHWKRYVRICPIQHHPNEMQMFIECYFQGFDSSKIVKNAHDIGEVVEDDHMAIVIGWSCLKNPKEWKPQTTAKSLNKMELDLKFERDMRDAEAAMKELENHMKGAGFNPENHYDGHKKQYGTSYYLGQHPLDADNWDSWKLVDTVKLMSAVVVPAFVKMNEPIIDDSHSKMNSHTKDIFDVITRRRFVILEGVPGTGKTHIFKEMKGHFAVTRFLTFHPSSDYSSFIGGIRPGEKGDELIFNPTKGHLLKILEEADEEDKPVLLWIDELNRANVPRVFGDLISLIGNSDPPALQIHNAGLEKGDRLVITSNQKKNLHIVATMNTSDRSVTPLDAALRRRFSFVRLQPKNTMEELTDVNPTFSKLDRHIGCFLKLNDILRKLMGEDAILGHSYLFEMLKDRNNVRNEPEIVMIWKYSILPNIVDTLMLTQSFDEIKNINIALAEANIQLMLVPKGKGLGEIILVEEVN